MKIFKINKPLLICVATGFSLTISACDNAQKIYPNIYTDKTESGSSTTSYDYSNQSDSINHSITQLEWSALNDDEQVNEIKRIIENYGGELQGLAYSDTGIITVADVYVLNADISAAKHLQLTEKLSKLIGTPVVVNIQDSKLTQEMGSLEKL